MNDEIVYTETSGDDWRVTVYRDGRIIVRTYSECLSPVEVLHLSSALEYAYQKLPNEFKTGDD